MLSEHEMTLHRLRNLPKHQQEAIAEAAGQMDGELRVWSSLSGIGLYLNGNWLDHGDYVGCLLSDLDFNMPLAPQLEAAMLGNCDLCGVKGTLVVPLSRGTCPLCLGLDFDEISSYTHWASQDC